MVNQSNIFKKIGYILNELQDQYEFLSENPEHLSELELELFLANANFLSDHIQIVKKLNDNPPLKELQQAPKPEQPAAVPAPAAESKAAPEPVPEEFIKVPVQSSLKDNVFKIEDSPSTFEFMIDETEPKEALDLEEVVEDNHHEEMVDHFEDVETEVSESIPPVDKPKKNVEDEVGPEPFLVAKEPVMPEPTTRLMPDPVEEKVVQSAVVAIKPTINDMMANQKSANINTESSKPAITDLKKAVTLNEKLLYIKDLFNGYNLAYSEAIDIINKLPDFKAAEAFLKNNYAIKNNWDSKPGTVDKFYELLRQRFPAD